MQENILVASIFHANIDASEVHRCQMNSKFNLFISISLTSPTLSNMAFML